MTVPVIDDDARRRGQLVRTVLILAVPLHGPRWDAPRTWQRGVLTMVPKHGEYHNECANISNMPANNGGNPAKHFGKQMKKERLSRGWSLREFAARSGINYSVASLIENGKRPPSEKAATACDLAFPERHGWFTEYYSELQDWTEVPVTFRSWSDYEERSASLRIWSPGIVHGLAQSAEYAAALIAAEPGIDAVTADTRLTARTERQRRVLGRDTPPKVWFIVDEVALWRRVGSAPAMATQMSHLATLAALAHVTVQVMPAIEHPAVASGYVLADDAVWCEHLAAGGVFTDPDIVSNITARHDSLRSECYRASESLVMIEKAGKAWARGASPLTQAATAETA